MTIHATTGAPLRAASTLALGAPPLAAAQGAAVEDAAPEAARDAATAEPTAAPALDPAADAPAGIASARALAAGASAAVVSVECRRGPDGRCPAPHEDANAAHVWAVESSASLNADSTRLVATTQMTYPGVTQEFFGMGAVVPEAREAAGMATGALTDAFATP